MRVSIQQADPSAMVHADGAGAAADDRRSSNAEAKAGSPVAATSERQLQAMSNPASVDTSRVASKYIGETEKHLDSALGHAQRSCALLLFDEADALFGKRSDVKDSHD